MNANLIITAAGVIVALFTRPDDRADRVEQQRLAKPAPLLRTIDREPPEHGRRHRIMRQPLCQNRRQFVFLEARGTQAAIAGDRPRRVADGDEHLRQAPPHILGGLPLEIGIEGRLPSASRSAPAG